MALKKHVCTTRQEQVTDPKTGGVTTVTVPHYEDVDMSPEEEAAILKEWAANDAAKAAEKPPTAEEKMQR